MENSGSRSRSDTSSSDEMEEMMIFPITDIDNISKFEPAEDNAAEADIDDIMPDTMQQRKPLMTLRQRRHSRLLGMEGLSNLNVQLANKMAQNVIIKGPLKPHKARSARANWLRAFRKIRSLEDPWAKFNITDHDIEKCKRHRYNALKKKWLVDEVYVKMENTPFNCGAMRECFRLKKLASFIKNADWNHALNYVAKRYMEDVPNDVYFEDVCLQMDAKLWGEEYNRHHPPKKADIFQMYILEFVEREGAPLYHLEHFIEGDYIKYNSNSGFVEENLRLTPQAFSHFTFERSGHKMIVVDIQGVGDLWTDPQIHTCDEKGYGDGNLGTRGMALFFHSHVCNTICGSLNLSKFDISPTEKAQQYEFIKNNKCMLTMIRSNVDECILPTKEERGDLYSFLARNQTRISSSGSALSADSGIGLDHALLSPAIEEESEDEPMSPMSPAHFPLYMVQRHSRTRFESESDSSVTQHERSVDVSSVFLSEENVY